MAVTLTDLVLIREQFVETGLSDVALQYHLDAASELVLREAPAAPDSVHNEAVIRVVGWFVNQPMSAQRSLRVGEFSQGFMVGGEGTNALRSSGAARLLSAYKIRRAGSI